MQFVLIGDYTDFYSSKEHTNVGKMFRDPGLYYLTGFIYL
jgi:fumarylacetoacetase